MKKIISVCGSDLDDEHLSSYALKVAEQIGRLVAQNGFVLLCGGRGGIMEAACRGAKEENGLTIGLLPYSKDEANNYIDIRICLLRDSNTRTLSWVCWNFEPCDSNNSFF